MTGDAGLVAVALSFVCLAGCADDAAEQADTAVRSVKGAVMRGRTGALTSWGIVLPRGKRGWQGLTRRQRVGIVVRTCLQTGLQVVAARDLLRRPADEVRGGRKWPWALAIAMNYLGVGPTVYLVGGRRPDGR